MYVDDNGEHLLFASRNWMDPWMDKYAWITGDHTFIVPQDDPIGAGFRIGN